MGRPPRYAADELLDAAVRLAADTGPQAVSMTAVAAAAGVPSGSLYHRFASRPALLAALWLRTVERFQEGFLAATTADPPQVAAVAAARHVITWAREHPAESRVLRYGASDFAEPEWPEAERERLANANAAVAAALRALADRLGPAMEFERLAIAVVDLPYATIRRHTAAGRPLPPGVEEFVAGAVAAAIGGAG